jgi:hypothetical protein
MRGRWSLLIRPCTRTGGIDWRSGGREHGLLKGEQPGPTKSISQPRETPAARATRDAAATTPCLPGQPTGGEYPGSPLD